MEQTVIMNFIFTLLIKYPKIEIQKSAFGGMGLIQGWPLDFTQNSVFLLIPGSRMCRVW